MSLRTKDTCGAIPVGESWANAGLSAYIPSTSPQTSIDTDGAIPNLIELALSANIIDELGIIRTGRQACTLVEVG